MVHPISFPEAEPTDFWPAYLGWQRSATVEELRQLEVALEALPPTEVMPLQKAIRLAMCDAQVHSMVPTGLMERLRHLQWPAGRAVA